MTPDEDREGPLPAFLLVLTVVTGIVDAVSFLALGRVFVANMTGNVVFLGLGLAGAPDLSPIASLVAIASFMAGAVAGGRLAGRSRHRARLLAAAIAITLGFVAASLCLSPRLPEDAALRYALVVLLALGMGVQNATARHLAVRDVTTTVLTTTLTGLAADSTLAGGSGLRGGRRALAALCVLAGAALGAGLVLKVSAATALAVAAALLAANLMAVWRWRASTAPWTAER